MEIKKFFKRDLQHLEHYQFTDHLLSMAKEANVEKLTAVLKPLEDAFKAEDEAVFPQRGNAMNAQLRELDDRRDKAYYSLQHAVDAGLYSEEAEELEAAKRVSEIMKRYAGVATMNYDKETGGLKNLLADLAETEAAKALKVLHAEGAVKRIGDHNKAFDEAFRGRFSGDKKLYDMKALRRVTDKAIDAVVRRIDSLDDLEPSAAITALINRYNQLVDNRHTLLKQRETSNAKANAAKIEEQRKMLTPLFDDLAKILGVAAEDVHYSGESRGSGTSKCYRLTIDSRSSNVWVKVSRKKLVQVAESEVPKAKNGGKKNGGSDNGRNGSGSGNGGSGNGSQGSGSGSGGSGNGSGNGSGSGNPGGNKPGSGGQGGATITPKK
ncbi:hypothetical protein HMPREF9431_02404 [Segatella oulorum F0390]|uniref:Hemagglutinin protein HagB n=1 Tax=Segatella oulorum F0390 TaxID=702438 RepID=G1WEW7_9BACT|nr:DUF6261 family protein [Segatella oulorum]EGV28967.1 hypothetical protein HMPREF9431_02404 [Segatella oulorum F0390]